MEDEIVKKIAELLGSETGIETEKVYNYIQDGLKKREIEKLKKELSEKTKEIEDKKIAQKDDVKTKEETKKENKEPLIIVQDTPNYKQIRPEGRLHVVADIKKNKYYLMDEESNILESRVINGVEDSIYKKCISKILIKKRSNELIKQYKYVNEKNVGNVDTITYKLLKDFDEDYSTKYAEKYLKMVTLNPSRNQAESDEKYKAKVINSKKKALNEMNIDFTYNTKGILFFKGVKLKDKIQYMKMVSKQQNIFGAKVNSSFLGLFRNKNKMLDSGRNEYVQTKKKLSLSKSKIPKMKFKSFHMPKLNINIDKQKAKKYFGRTVMAGIAGLSLFGAIYQAKTITNVNNKENKAIEYEMENNKNDNDFKKQVHVNIEQNIVKVKQENKEASDIIENIDDVEQKNPVITKLSNLVNNKWEISSGKYYSSPDGTGNSGNFKNYQEAVKVDLLNLLDEQGNKICTISPDELSNLPEDIAEQVKGFQYHVSNENTVLGWNTDKQLDELNESDSMHSVQEEKDSDMEIGE